MSPTEFDLRAALRDGEGDGVDPDVVIAGGRRQQAQRRSRIMSTVAAVVLVGAAGVGGTLIFSNSGSGTSTSAGGGNAQSDARTHDNAAAGGGSLRAESQVPPSGVVGGAAYGVDAKCPTSLPRYLLPGGGSPGQLDTSAALFARPVASVLVCSYGTPQMALGAHPVAVPARLVLHGAQARRLTNSLEHSATVASKVVCPTIRAPEERELAFIAIGANGKPMTTVTANLAEPACDVRVTNGSALRYRWLPPDDLKTLLLALQPGTDLTASPPVVRPSGDQHGSPIQS
jgi:hypothetical protein